MSKLATFVVMGLLGTAALSAQDQNGPAPRKGNVVAIQRETSNQYPEVRYFVVLAIKEGAVVNRFLLHCAVSDGYPCWNIGWLAGCSWEYQAYSSSAGPEEDPVLVSGQVYQCQNLTAYGACVSTSTKLGFSSTGEQREEVLSISYASGCASK
jgi:hypothetical protein